MKVSRGGSFVGREASRPGNQSPRCYVVSPQNNSNRLGTRGLMPMQLAAPVAAVGAQDSGQIAQGQAVRERVCVCARIVVSTSLDNVRLGWLTL